MMIPNFAREIVDRQIEGYDRETTMGVLEDISTHGCASGMVGEVIYNSDIDRLFKDNTEELLEFLDDYQEETGADILDIIRQRSDRPFEELPAQAVWMAVEMAAYAQLSAMEAEEE